VGGAALFAQAREQTQRALALAENGPADGASKKQVRELAGELDEEEKDRQLLAALDEARLAQAETVAGQSRFASERAVPLFREALRAYGLPVGVGEPAAVAARIRRRPARVREALVAALDQWIDLAANPLLTIAEPHRDWLQDIMVAAEPEDGWTRRLRAAIAKKDVTKRRAALEKLAEEANVGKLPAQSLTRLAGRLESVEAGASAVRLLRRARERNPADFWINHDLGQALQTATPPDREGSVRFLTAAVALRPESAGAHSNLGVALERKGQGDEAMACFQMAIALDPKLTTAHYNLGVALKDKGQVDEAMACFQKAVALDPKDGTAHYNLGIALRDKGQVNEAITCFQMASALDPKNANALGALGRVLLDKGRYAEAREVSAQALTLLPANHPKRAFVSRQLQECERLLKLEARLPGILRGEDQPASARESLDLAHLCVQKKMNAAAARFWATAFAAEAKLADDLQARHRYNAARSAALAAAGQGEDATKLDDKERARLRQQALDWLRADLALRTMQLDSGWPGDRAAVQQQLRHWQKDSDLAGIRDKAALGNLPTEEGKAVAQLWADVAALLKKAETPAQKETPR
jgi:tetratricopeptide (TPR) repeat protein